MNLFQKEDQGGHAYLVYELPTDMAIDTVTLGMLTNNDVPGLAPALFTQMDAAKYVKYDISARIPINQFLEGYINRKKFLSVLANVTNTILKAEDYMICAESLVLNMDYVYVDPLACDAALVCIPVLSQDSVRSDTKTFLRQLVFGAKYDPGEENDYIAILINFLNGATFSLEGFGRLLGELLHSQETSSEKTVVHKAEEEKTVSQKVSLPEKEKAARIIQKAELRKPDTIRNPFGGDIPGQSRPGIASGDEKLVQTEQENEISLFYLLQHYNKENAARYKEQKEARKAKQTNGKKKKELKKILERSIPFAQDYAVPGREMVELKEPASFCELKKADSPKIDTDSQDQLEKEPVKEEVEETVLMASEPALTETCNLDGMDRKIQREARLLRRKNNQLIILDKPIFRIGKDRGSMDYVISDNGYISGRHASVLYRDGEYYIMDTNSKNHTYLGDLMLESNKEVLLTDRAVIRLADEEFEFRLI